MGLEKEGLGEEVKAIWEHNAAFWDDYFGEGNQFQRHLIGPATDDLLQVQPGEFILDVACGNGHYARRMAERGATVLACDVSPTFIERARARSEGFGDRITYRMIDATNTGQLLSLGERTFDAAVCTMAMMDMVTIEPLIEGLSRLLKPGGRFVFSVIHPCFNSSGMLKVVEETDVGGELVTTFAIKVSGYKDVKPQKGLGIIGQPAAQYYFHRPISELFQVGFDAGFVLDGLLEPAFDETADPARPFSWANFTQIPPVLVARMRLQVIEGGNDGSL